jgi:DUF4097 and DUF4098 domain-containing protein YvlB
MIRLPILTVTLVAAVAAGAWAQPPIQAKPGGPDSTPRTDQTVDVTKGTRLVLTNNAGEVVVRSWDRDQVRVQASHSDREQVDIQTADTTLRIRARGSRGPTSLVDYQVTVPRWMPVNLSGSYLEATVEGTTAEVTVETVHGNVRVVGGSGNVLARSVQGTITVEKAAGRVQATTVNEGIRVSNVTGDVSADTTNGDIIVDNAQSSSLSVSTVNGDVTFNGTVRDNGSYRLATHGGDIRIGLGGASNAIVFVRTFQGDFSADFPIQLPDGQTARSGSKRFNFTLGNGSARIELQSFNGDIEVAKGRIATTEELREMRRKGEGKPKGMVFDHDMGHEADHDVDVDVEVDIDDDDFDFDHDVDVDVLPVVGDMVDTVVTEAMKEIAATIPMVYVEHVPTPAPQPAPRKR